MHGVILNVFFFSKTWCPKVSINCLDVCNYLLLLHSGSCVIFDLGFLKVSKAFLSVLGEHLMLKIVKMFLLIIDFFSV